MVHESVIGHETSLFHEVGGHCVACGDKIHYFYKPTLHTNYTKQHSGIIFFLQSLKFHLFSKNVFSFKSFLTFVSLCEFSPLLGSDHKILIFWA